MAQTQTASTSRKSWWIMGFIITLISIASSATVYFLLDSNSMANAQDTASEAKPPTAPPPIFVTVSPFTVNLQSEHYEQRLLYVGLSLKVGDEETRQLLEQSMPQVRSRLLMLLSSQEAEALITPQGKATLSQDILALFEEPFSDPQPKLAVNDVLYTDFIVQ